MARIEINSEVTGNVWKVEVTVGDAVAEGDTMIILESMKMEIPVEAPQAGKIIELHVKPEDPVEEDQLIAVLDA